MNKKYMVEAEALAMEGMKRIRAFFAYEGSDPKYFQKARLGAAVGSAYSRLYATRMNGRALRLAERRLALGVVEPTTQQLKALNAIRDAIE